MTGADEPVLNKKEKDKLVAVFELLMQMDKKQNPETYSGSGDTKDVP